jgi:UDP-N-acetyl-D-mannosaminuronate dehydrogenase
VKEGIVSESKNVVVVGLGEVGRPLFELASQHHQTFGVDVEPCTEKISRVDVLHICIPFGIRDFIGESVRYVEKFQPELTIIDSTVAVGTTRAIAECTGAAVVNSPVRGKHVKMLADMLLYTKFVGAIDRAAGQQAAKHFESLGMKTRILSSPEATELAKLTETTYFGVIIAWAQEVERYCDQFGPSYEEVASFYEEINYLPRVKFFPGVIGGHCVIPNIEILMRLVNSDLLRAIRSSNQQKMEREAVLCKVKAASQI